MSQLLRKDGTPGKYNSEMMKTHSQTLIDKWSAQGDRVFHLNDGLIVNLKSAKTYVSGGDYQLVLAKQGHGGGNVEKIIENVERKTLHRIIAVGGGSDPDIIFRTQNGFIKSNYAAEDMLWKSQEIEFCLRWILGGSNYGPDQVIRERCEVMMAMIEDGHIGVSQLDRFIQSHQKLPIKEAFMLHNVVTAFEDMRGALLRSSAHLLQMVMMLFAINNREKARNIHLKMNGKVAEIKHSSPSAHAVSNVYTSAIIACYSALDLLLRFFVFLTREQFLDPSFPTGLHFSEVDSGSLWKRVKQHKPGDLGAQIVPKAIPHLTPGYFLGLRRLRNDLVHNMAADDVAPQIYVGIGTKRISGLQVQYAEYRTWDVDMSGAPERHPWCPRFYQQDRSAELVVYDWLAKVWECVNDTCQWLTERVRCDAALRGINIPRNNP